MNKSNLLYAILILAVFILLPACKENKSKQANESTKTSEQSADTSQDKGKVAFKINGRPVYEDEMSARNIDEAIKDEILYEAALIKGVDKEPQVEKTLNMYRRNLITGVLRKQIIDEAMENYQVSDENINNYYEEHKDNYITLDVNKLIIQDKSKADEVYNKLSGGEAIEDVVEEYKTENSEIILQQLYNNRKLSKEFDSFEVGEVSKPIDEQNNAVIYVITKVEIIPLDKVKRQIAYILMNLRKAIAVNAFIEKAKREENIKIEKSS